MIVGIMNKQTKAIKRAKAERSDGALGLSLILKDILHYEKHGDYSSLLSFMTSGTARDFRRLKRIVEVSTNIHVAGSFDKKDKIKVIKNSKVKTNETFKELSDFANKNVSFRSIKLDHLLGQLPPNQIPNFNTASEVKKLIRYAKNEGERDGVVQALEACWYKIKTLKQ